MKTFKYKKSIYHEDKNSLIKIKEFILNNPFLDDLSDEFDKINKNLLKAFEISEFEEEIQIILKNTKKDIDSLHSSINVESQTKKENFENLVRYTKEYSKNLDDFYKSIHEISNFNFSCKTQTIELKNHKLYIENNFSLTKETLIENINKYLKKEYRINNLSELSPSTLFESSFSKKNPKIINSEDFKKKIYDEFLSLSKNYYKIETKDEKAFEDLSAGWKTSILLDIILSYEEDLAPLIIDQPEDNLATNYINGDLISSIKNIKHKKQIILVSHNATIPMLGDAQNIIYCKEDNKKVKIRSSRLEDSIDSEKAIDIIAKITDGGKSSIKKRYKKYNLKNFRED